MVARLLRVSAYVFATALAVIGLAAEKAHASASEGALAIGERLLDVPTENGGREIEINGQPLHVVATQSPEPLAVVLDAFEKACEEHADDMLERIEALGRSGSGFPGIGVLKDRRGDRGVVSCFAVGRPSDPFELARRLERFATTKDVADLGRLRFVAARTLEGGATQIVATSTEGSVRLGAMFPEVGDAAGEDPTYAPRPVGVRVLSAHDRHAPYGLFVYRTTKDPASYEKTLLAAGWVAHPTGHARDLAFGRPGIDVLVTTEEDDDGSTLLSIVEMPEGGRR